MLINKHYINSYLISKASKVPLTFDNFLFYYFSELLIYNAYYSNSRLCGVQQVSKLALKKSVFKLFYLPIKTNILITRQSKFFYNPICSQFFTHTFSANITKLLSLFYTMGQENKKILFFSIKHSLANITSILTRLSFGTVRADFIGKLLYVLTQKKIKTKRKKLKKVLARLDAYSIFFLTLPKSRRFIRYMKDTSLVTVGLTNLNTFDLNIPIIND